MVGKNSRGALAKVRFAVAVAAIAASCVAAPASANAASQNPPSGKDTVKRNVAGDFSRIPLDLRSCSTEDNIIPTRGFELETRSDVDRVGVSFFGLAGSGTEDEAFLGKVEEGKATKTGNKTATVNWQALPVLTITLKDGVQQFHRLVPRNQERKPVSLLPECRPLENGTQPALVQAPNIPTPVTIDLALRLEAPKNAILSNIRFANGLKNADWSPERKWLLLEGAANFTERAALQDLIQDGLSAFWDVMQAHANTIDPPVSAATICNELLSATRAVTASQCRSGTDIVIDMTFAEKTLRTRGTATSDSDFLIKLTATGIENYFRNNGRAGIHGPYAQSLTWDGAGASQAANPPGNAVPGLPQAPIGELAAREAAPQPEAKGPAGPGKNVPITNIDDSKVVSPSLGHGAPEIPASGRDPSSTQRTPPSGDAPGDMAAVTPETSTNWSQQTTTGRAGDQRRSEPPASGRGGEGSASEPALRQDVGNPHATNEQAEPPKPRYPVRYESLPKNQRNLQVVHLADFAACQSVFPHPQTAETKQVFDVKDTSPKLVDGGSAVLFDGTIARSRCANSRLDEGKPQTLVYTFEPFTMEGDPVAIILSLSDRFRNDSLDLALKGALQTVLEKNAERDDRKPLSVYLINGDRAVRQAIAPDETALLAEIATPKEKSARLRSLFSGFEFAVRSMSALEDTRYIYLALQGTKFNRIIYVADSSRETFDKVNTGPMFAWLHFDRTPVTIISLDRCKEWVEMFGDVGAGLKCVDISRRGRQQAKIAEDLMTQVFPPK